MYISFVLVWMWKIKWCPNFILQLFCLLSVTEKSDKGLEMQHQEVKSQSLLWLPSPGGEAPMDPVPQWPLVPVLLKAPVPKLTDFPRRLLWGVGEGSAVSCHSRPLDSCRMSLNPLLFCVTLSPGFSARRHSLKEADKPWELLSVMRR